MRFLENFVGFVTAIMIFSIHFFINSTLSIKAGRCYTLAGISV
jgi:hypothetical protein